MKEAGRERKDWVGGPRGRLGGKVGSGHRAIASHSVYVCIQISLLKHVCVINSKSELKKREAHLHNVESLQRRGRRADEFVFCLLIDANEGFDFSLLVQVTR